MVTQNEEEKGRDEEMVRGGACRDVWENVGSHTLCVRFVMEMIKSNK